MSDSDSYLSPRVLQVIGIAGVIGLGAFWIVTGRQSELMMGTFVALALLSGGYKRTVRALSELTAREGDEE